jgi:hypothetical protein
MTNYSNHFPEIYKEIKQSVIVKINKLQQKNINKSFIYKYYEMLANDFYALGIGEICLNQDNKGAKKYFYLAGKIQEILFQKYDLQEVGISSSFVTMNKYNRLLLAMLSDSEELTFSLAKLLGGRPEEENEHGNPFINNVGYAVKYLIIEENEKAAETIENLKNIKLIKDLKQYKDHVHVLKAILERDENAVNKGLRYIIENHKKNKLFKDTSEELISIIGLGLGKLAKIKGLNIHIDDEIAPSNFLEKDIIEYPSLDLGFTYILQE